jgi:hypothetical protein
MADVLTNDDMIERYFQSDDDESEFEGFSDNEADVDVPNAYHRSLARPPLFVYIIHHVCIFLSMNKEIFLQMTYL